MYKEFHNIDELLEYAKTDKQITGDAGFVANRYPIRFVLFDNFNDSFEFIGKMHCNVESVEKWLDSDYPDIIMTHTALADNLSTFISKLSDNNVVIAPFSELARFYDNSEHSRQFDTLIRTIKSIESSQSGFNNKQRIYIPIVGLEGKMSMFAQDSQINIWYYKNSNKQNNYRLTLTTSTFGVADLSQDHTIVENVKQWMAIWKNQEAKHKIISLSKSLFANAEYAQPDNAFDFVTCNNVYEFLTLGLQLNFGEIEYKPQDEKHWLRLAKEIDINNFSFEIFFNRYFHIDELADYKVFLKTWFNCCDEFEKWLLCTFYLEKFCNQKSYICQCIKNCQSYHTTDFFASIALSIFDCDEKDCYIDERNICMSFATDKDIQVSIDVAERLKKELEKIAELQGYAKAIRYITHLTFAEKETAISWLGQGKIDISYVKDSYPDLYNYAFGKIDYPLTWITNYFKAYRDSKIANNINDDLEDIFNEQNNDNVSFNNWYNSFKTTKTILNSRTDIEIYYWIDGLGIEWIPFVSYLLSTKEGIYLNETYIARTTYPTTTANNKTALEELSHNTLKKIGDLDSHAHKNTNKYPDYIVEEFEIVSKAIAQIVNEYSGKKIAIVSDHGLTAMSQFYDGLNMAGVESDHGGRLAYKTNGAVTSDNKYIVCDDSKTLCALKHNSLCAKIPTGQSAHGGCSPEEILVPIFIISAKKEANMYSVKLITTEITGNNPHVEFEIKGVGIATPYILYNGKHYNLTKTIGDKYQSDNIDIIAAVTSVSICIGDNYKQNFNLKINIGAEEDDLFDF